MPVKFNEQKTISNIVLIGFMGAGKTTIGQALSHFLQLPVIDSDKVIEQNSQKTIPELFKISEKLFREQETKFLQENSSKKKTIFSLGGGIIEKEKNRALLQQLGVVFFLETPFSMLWDRIKDSLHRPIAARDNKKINQTKQKTNLQNLYNQRLPLYKTADFTIPNEQTIASSTHKITEIYNKINGKNHNT